MITLDTISDVYEFNKSLDDGQYYTLIGKQIVVYGNDGGLVCELDADVSDQVWMYLESRR